jgi:membrane protease subunit HflK
MKWQMQGGGPWGGGPRGPWGGGPRSGDGSGPPGGGRGQPPPNLEELLRRSQDRFRRALPGGFGTGTGIGLVAIAIFVIWLASGFYIVRPDEVGIVLRFGAYNRTTQPGLNYHFPEPIETALMPKVTRINRTDIGFRTEENAAGTGVVNEDITSESLMLTGDENIVDVNFTVFWFIKNPKAYLFSIRAPEKTVKSAAESAMREIIGENPLAMELSAGRASVEADTKKLLQQLLDDYRAGIEITQVQLQRVDPPGPVIAAFRDVQAALADQARLRNEAQSYANSIVPQAKGNAVRRVQEAEAYRQQVVAHAQGDAARFDAVYRAYLAAKDVTRRRLYIETMEQILGGSNKIIIDKSAEAGTGVLPYLPLPGLTAQTAPAAAPSGSSPPSEGGGR